jgi:hypothetical protein
VASWGCRRERGSTVRSGSFNRKTRTALRHLKPERRAESKKIDFSIVFAESATDAVRLDVGNPEADIVTASKFSW